MNLSNHPIFRTLVGRFDHWVFEEYRVPPRALSLFRIVYATFVLLLVGVPPFRWIGGKPDFFFDPQQYGFVNLFFDSFPGGYFFWGLDVLVTLLFVFLLFGFRTRGVSWLLALVLFTGFSWSYAYGKINHDTLLMALVPLVMGFSGWGSHYSIDQRRSSTPGQERYWPVALLALLLGFGMFSAGIPKLLSGWLDPTTQAVQGYTIRQHYDFFADQLLTPVMMHYENPFFWELLDYSAVLFEVGFLLAVARQPLFRGFVMLAVVFHLGNSLMLNIDFSRNIALYLLFIDWRPLVGRFEQRIGPVGAKYLNVRMLILVSVLFLAYYLVAWLSPFQALIGLLGASSLTSGVLLTGLASVFFVVNFLTGQLLFPTRRYSA